MIEFPQWPRAASVLLLASVLFTAPAARTQDFQASLDAAYEAVAADTSGEVAQYIPALASADPDRFALVIVTADGDVFSRGDADVIFPIMSAAKPFTLALLLQQRGADFVRETIGVEPTGLPFNALTGIERGHGHPMNPMVNAGAITAVSHIVVDQPEQRWPIILDTYGRFAGEPLNLMPDVLKSVSVSNYRNRALVNLLQNEGWLGADPTASLDAYNKQSCVGINTVQLAVMGATLANAGVNPITEARVVDTRHVDEVLSVMMLSGFYDESGWWAYSAGLPAKSGVGGGVVAVVPGEMAIAAFSPRLSEAGNSVRALRAIQHLSEALDLSLFK
jgi:glutaminase